MGVAATLPELGEWTLITLIFQSFMLVILQFLNEHYSTC